MSNRPKPDPNSFEKITMYRCKLCGKQLQTNQNHICRFSVKSRGCLCCDLMGGVRETENGDKKVRCMGTKGMVPIHLLSKQRWYLNCDEFVPSKEGEGKEAYLQHLRRINGEENTVLMKLLQDELKEVTPMGSLFLKDGRLRQLTSEDESSEDHNRWELSFVSEYQAGIVRRFKSEIEAILKTYVSDDLTLQITSTEEE